MKDAKINFIVDAATKVFLEKSINEATIKDVAEEAGVGEATIYRYFVRKQALVERVARKLQKKVFDEYFDLKKAENGFEKLGVFYNSYLKIFTDHPEFYKFINEFDAFCVSENISDLEKYSDGLDVFKDAFMSAYDKGLSDGSVKDIGDVKTFYYSTAHALLALCKKLAGEGNIVRQDGATDKAEEIKTLVSIVLNALKA
ncbi:MAG: helix-turn-helix transcriptional regulator, partial [Clostridia bacterium]|nr:helix-turn-helix transcriptional regulator [Clostridia bacterium]